MGIRDWFGGPKEPWRKLVDAKSVELIDDDTGEVLDLPAEQPEPGDVNGLLLRFVYCDATGRTRRRLVLCDQCWTKNGFLYLHGFCSMADALRTFRTDRMSELEEVRSNRSIDDIDAYFGDYAQDSDALPPGREASVMGAERPTPKRDVEQEAYRRHVRHRARHACIAGLRVLAYVALADDLRSEEERNVEMSFVESRLAMLGFDRDPDVTVAMLTTAAALAVPLRSLTIAINAVAKDEAYFRLVLSCVELMVTTDGIIDAAEAEAVTRLLAAGRAKGYLATTTH